MKNERASAMKIKVLACETLYREIYLAAARSPHICDVKFLPRDYHDDLDLIREFLQHGIDLTNIDRSSEDVRGIRCPVCLNTKYDAIVLAMGICGCTTVGLEASTAPLILPRIHDCFGLLLGGNSKYLDEEKCTVFYHQGAVERLGVNRVDSVPKRLGLGRTLEEYVKDYGEDNGRYIFDLEHKFAERNKRAVFLYHEDFVQAAQSARKEVERYATQMGWEVDLTKIDMDLFYNLLAGNWDDENFIVIDKGGTVDVEPVAGGVIQVNGKN